MELFAGRTKGSLDATDEVRETNVNRPAYPGGQVANLWEKDGTGENLSSLNNLCTGEFTGRKKERT
jgi:hypothetical protein